MEKVLEVQRQVRENTKVLHSYMTDLQNWESEMKRKEAALNGVLEQDLPPVRSKIKKEKPVVVKKKPEKRIPSSDYKAWDKFDVDKACEEVEMAEVGPPSLDSKKSQDAKLAKLREEALFEKERGNTFVKAEKWDEAIACYNRAIELVKDDAIYYANRGLCYLKKESLHQAESDCTEALRLDPTYVKALQRRATARERLGSLRAASHDLTEVLRLEPHNNAAKAQLRAITQRMGTKGSKSKSSPNPSPVSTPNVESKSLPTRAGQAKIVELPDEPRTKPDEPKKVDLEEQWRNGVGESVTVIKTVKKPPHLRSKRALKPIPILEVPLGKSSPEKAPTRLKIIEIEDERATGDNNNNDSNKTERVSGAIIGDGDKKMESMIPSVEKAGCDGLATEKLVPPNNSVQFLQEWKNLSGNRPGKRHYLSYGEHDISMESMIPSVEKAGCDGLATEKLVPPNNSVQFLQEWKNLSGNRPGKRHYLSVSVETMI
ncbi:TPR repeat domain-containing protein [Phthorimaea operculella]|nr:TPR repeat domain-containing protein [Phthorimaea operculella]